ncbi:MAG: porin family protein [Maribacter sp.]
MKKVLFTITLSILFVTGLQAQGDLKFGVTGGVVNSTVRGGLGIGGFNIASAGLANKVGFFVGATVDYGISEKFHAQPELLYVAAGDLSYVQLPIMAKYYIIDKLYAQVGPQFSFSTNADKIKNLLSSVNAEDNLKSTGVDIAFGAGYEILDNLSVQARFATELTNRISGLSSIPSVKTSNFYIGVVFLL